MDIRKRPDAVDGNRCIILRKLGQELKGGASRAQLATNARDGWFSATLPWRAVVGSRYLLDLDGKSWFWKNSSRLLQATGQTRGKALEEHHRGIRSSEVPELSCFFRRLQRRSRKGHLSPWLHEQRLSKINLTYLPRFRLVSHPWPC